MLASITPLGERGRKSTWGVTVTAFAIGGVAGGAAFGALAGELGALVLGHRVSGRVRLAVLAAALIAALVADLREGPAPGPRRQVDETWLTRFRGWVYGLAFGAQLGFGLSTVISSAATYVAVLAALLSGSAARGAVVLGVFGALRGLTPLLAARVTSPPRLFALHQRLDRLRVPARRVTFLAMSAMFVTAMIGALT
jgi:hypothetical protein